MQKIIRIGSAAMLYSFFLLPSSEIIGTFHNNSAKPTGFCSSTYGVAKLEKIRRELSQQLQTTEALPSTEDTLHSQQKRKRSEQDLETASQKKHVQVESLAPQNSGCVNLQTFEAFKPDEILKALRPWVQKVCAHLDNLLDQYLHDCDAEEASLEAQTDLPPDSIAEKEAKILTLCDHCGDMENSIIVLTSNIESSNIFEVLRIAKYKDIWKLGSISVIADLGVIIQYLDKRDYLNEEKELKALFQTILKYLEGCKNFQELRNQLHPAVTQEQKEQMQESIAETEKKFEELIAEMPEEEAETWDPHIHIGDLECLN